MRRAVTITAGVVLLVEALGVVVFNWVMGIVVDRQRMSLAGLDPDTMSAGTWVLGALNGLLLGAAAVVLLRAGIADRAPRRWARVLVAVCAVLHAVMGAVLVGPAGWAAFAGAMAALGLLVLSLLVFREMPSAPGPVAGQGPAEARA